MSAIVVASVLVLGGEAHGAVAFEDADFGGYASATAVRVDALQAGTPGPRVADLEVGYSAASADSQGLNSAIRNEMDLVAQPAQVGKNSYGRGSAVEVGLVEDVPLSSQDQALILAGLVEATAPPTTDPAPRQIEVDNLDPVVYASAATGDAAAAYNPLSCLTDGQMGFGRAHAAKVQLLNTGTTNPDGSMTGPVLAIDSPPDSVPPAPERNAVDSRSATYLVANPNGTYGVVSETRMTIAPVSLLTDPVTNTSALTIEVLGEWVLRVHASGLAPATITYGPDAATAPQTKVLRVLSNGVEAGALTFQQLLGGQGLEIPGLPLLRVALGEDPRAIAAPGAAPDSTSQPTKTITEGAAAVDVVSIQVLGFASPIAPAHVADIRVGHMEVRANVPAGGIDCSNGTTTTTTAAPTTSTTPTTAPSTTTTTAPPNCPGFSGSATATVLHADALQAAPNGPRLADVEVGFSGASANSAGLTSARENENQVVFQPARPAKKSYGLGSAVEVGLGTSPPLTDEQQQIKLAGRSTAEAPPNQSPTPSEVGTFDALDPLLFANLLKGEARAAFDTSDNVTTPGDMAFGRAYVANVDLINGGGSVGPDGFSGPLLEVGANSGGPEREASESRSRTYLEAFGGGRYALVSETRVTIAPVTIGMGSDSPDDDITIEVLGEWVLRLRATGFGAATLQYGPAGSPSNNTPVLRVFQGGQLVNGLTLQDVLGQQGLVIPAGPLLQLVVGEDPRAIAAPGTTPDPTSSPTLTPTTGSAAVDVLSLQVLLPDAGNGPRLADVRLGHMEVRAAVPAGGIAPCPVAPAATTTTTAAPATTTTTAAPGATTTTTAAPGATTTTTAAPGATTTTTADVGGTNFNATTTTTAATQVLGQQFTRPDAAVAGDSRTRALPSTGAWIAQLALVGLCLLMAGAALVRVRRGRISPPFET